MLCTAAERTIGLECFSSLLPVGVALFSVAVDDMLAATDDLAVMLSVP